VYYNDYQILWMADHGNRAIMATARALTAATTRAI
jgi:hypothetical protein